MHDDDPEIFLGDAENVAEERGFDVAGKAPIGRDDGHAEGKTGSRNDTDGGVGPDPAPMADQVNEPTGKQRPQPGAHKEIDVHHVAQDSAAEDGVGEAMADVAHPAQNDVDADKAAERADDHRGRKPLRKNSYSNGTNKDMSSNRSKCSKPFKPCSDVLNFLNGWNDLNALSFKCAARGAARRS